MGAEKSVRGLDGVPEMAWTAASLPGLSMDGIFVPLRDDGGDGDGSGDEDGSDGDRGG